MSVVPRRVLVTGATGFVGSALLEQLAAQGIAVVAPTRTPLERSYPTVDNPRIGDIDACTDWRAGLMGVEVVVHCASRVHVMQETSVDALSAFRRTNVEGTAALAEQARCYGVRRFVFLSSVKVNGEQTKVGQTFRSSDPPAPADPYATSKFEAEVELARRLGGSATELVILRPPLVYGPGVKGNLRALLSLVQRGIPLPLGAIDNRRSMISIDNLVSVVERCAIHPRAAGETFMVSDGEDVSTPNLVRWIGEGLGVPARLFSCPKAVLVLGACAFGRKEQLQRMCGNLQVDSAPVRAALDWQPRSSPRDGIIRMARWFSGRREQR